MTRSALNVNWRPDTTTALDSLWAHLHKLAYLNAVGFPELARLFDSKGGRPWGVYDRRLDQFGRLDVAKLARAICVPEQRMELLLPSAYRIKGNIADVLRYCPVCILRGFHSAAFQMKAILRCPLHGVMLESQCAGCGFTIPYQFGPRLRTPFTCQCGFKLWPGITAERWPRSLHADQENVFLSLYRWSEKVRTADRTRRLGNWGSRWMSVDNTGPLACFEPFDGWSPEHFGLGRRNVVTKTYRGVWQRAGCAEAVPINVVDNWMAGIDELYPRFNGALGRRWSRKIGSVDETMQRRLGAHLDCSIAARSFGDNLVSYRGMCCLATAYYRWFRLNSISHWFAPLPNQRFLAPGRIEAAACTQMALDATNISVREQDPLPPLVTWLAMTIYEAWYFATYADELGRATREWHDRTHPKQYSLDPLSKRAHPIALRLAGITTHPVIAYYPGGLVPPKVKYYVPIGNDVLERLTASRCEIQKRFTIRLLRVMRDIDRTNPRSKWAFQH